MLDNYLLKDILFGYLASIDLNLRHSIDNKVNWRFLVTFKVMMYGCPASLYDEIYKIFENELYTYLEL